MNYSTTTSLYTLEKAIKLDHFNTIEQFSCCTNYPYVEIIGFSKKKKKKKIEIIEAPITDADILTLSSLGNV